MSEEEQVEKDVDSDKVRADVVFKDVTSKMAQAIGLELLNVELPRLPSTDLIVHVPTGKDLTDTIFDFFAPYDILEFKSENDKFNFYEFLYSLARSLLFFARFELEKDEELLNVFVCARKPDGVIKALRKRKIRVKADAGKPWLLRAKYGTLYIVFIVCRLLPVKEAKYDRWLIFAPTDDAIWQEFVKIAVIEGKRNILDLMRFFRREDLLKMVVKLKKDLDELPLEKRRREDLRVIELLQELIEMYEEDSPELFAKLFSKVKPESLIEGLTFEQRQTLLKLLLEADGKDKTKRT
jgi:hypothetical protein